MSSYYPSFNYMGYNSLKDKNLMVVHFESGDSGEMETFLSMDAVYTENAYGTRRVDYGARYNSVALIKITVMKTDGQDFNVLEVRDFLRWTTGVRKASYLDLVDQDGDKQIERFSFFGRVINVLQHKLDARTVGFTIEFESTSPWAYSPKQIIGGPLNQGLFVDQNNILYTGLKSDPESESLSVDDKQVLYNSAVEDGKLIFMGDGVVAINVNCIEIPNPTDDLYNYVYLDVEFENNNCNYIYIKNTTLGEETTIDVIARREIINISAEQFITSDMPNKVFGNTFNFVWPRLVPGTNMFEVDCDGTGYLYFAYRYPVKIGDCAIDISVQNDNWCCGNGTVNPDSSASTVVSWEDIINTPTTIEGYGITDAYNMSEVDGKIRDTTVDEQTLNDMLASILSK